MLEDERCSLKTSWIISCVDAVPDQGDRCSEIFEAEQARVDINMYF